ncbi:MAG: fructosamine kinase family protein [Bacteroidetes bacterium]|nr:MAG: fructosamine kinase family protein [Bacteroidota bacterium]
MNLTDRIASVTGAEVLRLVPAGGGSIAAAYRAEMCSGPALFVKTGAQHAGMFTAEAEGLRALAYTGEIRIPAVRHADEHLLVLELLPVTRPAGRARFFREFGARLARLHRHTAPSFGFPHDNFIGSTPQRNTVRSADWRSFYWEHRMLFQFRLAEKNRLAGPELAAAFHELERHLPSLIPSDGEPPALIHGDLWSGNYLCCEGDVPALIDPAAYYGHREAELGMTVLFGGFDAAFYEGYDEAYPLQKGWRERLDVYTLYHLLNHLNLFGAGYAGQVMENLRLLLRRR